MSREEESIKRKSEELLNLRRAVESEIQNYKYEFSQGCIGNPMRPDQIVVYIEKMKNALVEPYWTEVELRDSLEQINAENPPSRSCAVVADDQCGTLLLWDPVEKEFLLASRFSGGLLSFGVRGDAVGCFMAI